MPSDALERPATSDVVVRPSWIRKLVATGALVVTGAVTGAIVGAGAFLPLIGDIVDANAFVVPFIGAVFGAMLGGILAPIFAWTLLRRVPLWRAVLEPTIGALAGAILGTFVMLLTNGGLWPLLFALGGFLAAVVRLYNRFSPSPESDP